MTARNQASSNRLAYLLLAALGMLGCVQPAMAEDPPLSLTIRAMATEVVMGEPIVLDVTLKNEGEKPVEVIPEVVLSGRQNSHLLVTFSGEAPRSISSPSIRCGRFRNQTLQPNEQIEQRQWLLIDPALRGNVQGVPFALPRAGVYWVYMQYVTPAEAVGDGWVLISNPVKIRVREPALEHVDALRMLEASEFPDWFNHDLPEPVSMRWLQEFEDGTFYGTELDPLDSIAATESPYAPYAALLRGSIELAQIGIARSQEELREQTETRALRGREFLEAADTAGFPLRSDVVWYLREAAILLGNQEEVDRLTERLETEFAGTRAARRPIRSKRYTPLER